MKLIVVRKLKVSGYIAAIAGLFITSPAAFGMPYCRLSERTDLIEVNIQQDNIFEKCPANYMRVFICDAEIPSGRLRVIPVGTPCPNEQGHKVQRIDATGGGWGGSLSGVPSVLVMPDGEMIADLIEGELPAIDGANRSSKPTPFDRHFGAFVGSMVFAAFVGGCVAIYRIGKLRLQQPNKRSPAGPVSEPSAYAAWKPRALASGGNSTAQVDPGSNSAEQDAHYMQALDELDASNMDRVTWARALAASGGDNGRARAEYINRRVAKLAAT